MSKAVDEVVGNVVEHVGFVSVAAVIVDGSPKIFAGKSTARKVTSVPTRLVPSTAVISLKIWCAVSARVSAKKPATTSPAAILFT